MLKRRIHNPYSFAWALMPGGAALDLTGRELRLFMASPLDTVEITGFEVAENVISWTWAGADQKYLGKYDAVLVEVREAGPVTIDTQAAIELVAHTWEESELPAGVIELVTPVSLIPGPPGRKGDTGDDGRGIESADFDENYRLVITFTDGTTWTSEESLRGPQGTPGRDSTVPGPPGADGGLLFPTFEIDAAMHLQMSDNDAAVEDRFSIDQAGHLNVNF